MSDRSATLMQLTLFALMLVLCFGGSPAASARFAMCFCLGQAAAHGAFWWARARGKL